MLSDGSSNNKLVPLIVITAYPRGVSTKTAVLFIRDADKEADVMSDFSVTSARTSMLIPSLLRTTGTVVAVSSVVALYISAHTSTAPSLDFLLVNTDMFPPLLNTTGIDDEVTVVSQVLNNSMSASCLHVVTTVVPSLLQISKGVEKALDDFSEDVSIFILLHQEMKVFQSLNQLNP